MNWRRFYNVKFERKLFSSFSSPKKNFQPKVDRYFVLFVWTDFWEMIVDDWLSLHLLATTIVKKKLFAKHKKTKSKPLKRVLPIKISPISSTWMTENIFFVNFFTAKHFVFYIHTTTFTFQRSKLDLNKANITYCV